MQSVINRQESHFHLLKVLFIYFLWVLALRSTVIGQTAPSAWPEYLSEQGKFSIRLPGKPTSETRSLGLDANAAVTYFTNLNQGSKSWTVAYFDLSTPASTPEAVKNIFDRTRDLMLKRSGQKLAAEDESLLIGYRVRSFEATPDARHRVMVARIYLVGARVYEVWAVVPNGQQKSVEVNNFLDSFKPMPLTVEDVSKPQETARVVPDDAKPTKMKVSNAVLQQQALKKVLIVYPAALRNKTPVVVSVKISEYGDVQEATAVSGPESLWNAAVQAARQWKFRPILIQGSAVQLEGQLSFSNK